MTTKKRKSGNVSFNVIVDTEDGELLDFFWNEDHEPPPLVKPRGGTNEGKTKDKKPKKVC